MIYSLVGLQLGELFRCCTTYITPIDVPIAILIFHHFKSKLLKSLSHNDVSTLRCAQIQNHLLLFLFPTIWRVAVINRIRWILLLLLNWSAPFPPVSVALTALYGSGSACIRNLTRFKGGWISSLGRFLLVTAPSCRGL